MSGSSGSPPPDRPRSRQLASARPLTRQLVEIASVLRAFDVQYAALMMHRTVAELLPSVHEAMAIGVLVERGQQLAYNDIAECSPERPSFGWGSLTAAELRVARLASEGLTNQQIADRLELSRHTVESHLRHAFRKLDIGSRVELTRMVVIHDPAG
ncbi:LuxR family transcriptional regulator [Kribbella pittospori]|uniref:LuxR family transcriptional regulator n=1 Tax=Kribbella pittospori TaxID=722689 RepID=A0A4R0K5T3_9ACTN|nr:helix-turn-helix transcriptional regulator [Kribbella pittospori]TCC50365.1 LuxR family transcriptional regulator [Kribbella pittospori]